MLERFHNPVGDAFCVFSIEFHGFYLLGLRLMGRQVTLLPAGPPEPKQSRKRDLQHTGTETSDWVRNKQIGQLESLRNERSEMKKAP